ncbi:glycosyltransferase family 2 protein [Mesoflavibacter zeaxanthinifaciens]|uniref:glycosyltransferase family 2 protein n=1 Tax=Mesoflavibacter zeaxanthinifaciens TaxID=393060 RepID=UPI003A90D24D
MLDIIFPYRNRGIERVKKSLDALANQTNKNFLVHFVDYGSDIETAKQVEVLVQNYSFAKYQYHPTNFQPWNKSRALNTIIKQLKAGFCFVADIDMIFHPEFVARAITLQKENTATYFKVGFLSENETKYSKQFNAYSINFESTLEATGLTMFPVKALHKVKGFDEFYHFWGAEDTDVHVRLKNDGCEIVYYEKEILLLHQWHKSYRSKESQNITTDLQLGGVVRLNHQHLMYAGFNNKTSVNLSKWGEPLSKENYQSLMGFSGESKKILNRKEAIDYLLFCKLPEVDKTVMRFEVGLDDFQNSIKYKVKRLIGKNTPSYYTLKEVNDMLLTHIIVFYRDYDYIYRVFESENKIELTLKKP